MIKLIERNLITVPSLQIWLDLTNSELRTERKFANSNKKNQSWSIMGILFTTVHMINACYLFPSYWMYWGDTG